MLRRMTWGPSQRVFDRSKRTFVLVFFFQAEDGIRDGRVTGVQTCALPIFGPCKSGSRLPARGEQLLNGLDRSGRRADGGDTEIGERRVGKECRSRWSPYY